MRCEADVPEVGAAVTRIGELLAGAGATIDPGLVVRYADGDFSTHVDGPRVRDRVLVEYPSEYTTPLDDVEWSDDPDELVIVGGAAHLARVHRELLEAWVSAVNAAGKLSRIRSSVASIAVGDRDLRSAIARCGFTALQQEPTGFDPRGVLCSWHGGRGQRLRLLHLKCFVNHRDGGSPQRRVHGRTSVLDSATEDSDETFEHYGDLDAAQLLVRFGYLTDDPPLVHCAPVTLEDPVVGRVEIRGAGPRRTRLTGRHDAPDVHPTDTGLHVEHLTFRPDNHGRLVRYLAMAVTARSGALPPTAARTAASLLDDAATATLDRYSSIASAARRAERTPRPLCERLAGLHAVQAAKLDDYLT